MKLLTNSVLKTFPLGLEIEIIDSEYFLYNTKNFKNVDYLEHVTLGLYHNFKKDVKHFMATSDNSDIRFTIDYEDDLKFISKINQNLLYEKNYLTLLESFNKVTGSMRKTEITIFSNIKL